MRLTTVKGDGGASGGTQPDAGSNADAAARETGAPPDGAVTDLLAEKGLGKLGPARRLPVALGPHQGQVLLIK